MTDVVVVIPTYNEADNVVPLVEAIYSVIPELDLLFVDDDSQDGTADRIGECQDKYPGKIHLLSRQGNRGLGRAYIAAFTWALEQPYQVVISMDADLSHNPIYIPQMLRLLEQGDAVIGSRYVAGGGTRHWGIIRQTLSRFGSLYARTVLGIRVHDFTGGFNAWRRRVLEMVDLQTMVSTGYAFQVELKYRAHLAGCVLQETPILFVERRIGHSKMTTAIVLEAVWRVWALRRLRMGALSQCPACRNGHR